MVLAWHSSPVDSSLLMQRQTMVLQPLSQNVKLGLKFRYQNGQVQVNHNHFLGHTKDEEGK